MKVSDLVILKKDVDPIIYIIEEINDEDVLLKGYTHRIVRKTKLDKVTEAPLPLVEKEEKLKHSYERSLLIKGKLRNNKTPLFGRVLHIDGDQEYLDSCIALYKEVGIHVDGIYIKEKELKNKIEDIILTLTPDIVVITGHDVYNGKGIKELSNYENTNNFIDAIRKIRKHFSQDSMCIIAGACGSNFEALIASGANFASSPKRINIHTYDPAVIAIKVASTSCNKTIDFEGCLRLIEKGREAFGGIETNGKMKILL